MAEFEINYENRRLWHHLGIIIQEFEKSALKSETRDGFLAVANGPLEAADMVLEGSRAALTSDTWGTTKVSTTTSQKRNADGDLIASGSASGTYSSGSERPEKEEGDIIGPVGSESASVGFDISADVDFAAIFPDGQPGNAIADEIMNCFGMGANACKPKLKFKWQMQPIDLLGPIGDLVNSLNASIDSLNNQIDPFATWANFCEIGEEFKAWCIPDMVMMLMALKMLLRKYLSFQLEISLDWTVILAPILKLITQAISGLVTAIVGVMVSPIECAMSAVYLRVQLESQFKQVVATAQAVNARKVQTGKQVSDLISGVASGQSVEDSYRPVTGEQTTARLTRNTPGNAELPSGIDFSSIRRLPELATQNQGNTPHWSELILGSLAEARDYVTELDDKLQQALRNLNLLCGGGISISIGNIGLLLMVKDQIGLISTLINMAAKVGPGIQNQDFCTTALNNQAVIREGIQRTIGARGLEDLSLREIDDEMSQDLMAIYNGPRREGTIHCVNSLVGTDQESLLKQWIQELGDLK